METYLLWSYMLLYSLLSYNYIKKKNRILGWNNNVDPFSIFSASFFIYSAIGSFDRIGLYEKNLIIPILFYISALLGYVMLAIGYISVLKSIPQVFDNKPLKWNFGINYKSLVNTEGRVFLFFFIVVILLNISSFISLFVNFGSGMSYVENGLREERTVMSGPKAFMGSLFGLFLTAFPLYNIFKTKIISLFDVVLLLVFLMYSLASGHRTSLLTVVLGVLVFYNYKIRPVKFKKLLVWGGAGLFFFISLGHLRAESNVRDMMDLLSERGYEVFQIASSGEFSNTVESCYFYIERTVSGKDGYDFGGSWLNEIAMFVPAFLWPNRPLPLPEQYVKTYFPEAPDGYGKGWFVMTDGYMAFGLIGVMIEMFFIGIAMSHAYMYFMKRKNSLLHIMYIYMLFYSFIMTRGSFLSSVKNFLLHMLPFMLIVFISEKKSLRNQII